VATYSVDRSTRQIMLVQQNNDKTFYVRQENVGSHWVLVVLVFNSGTAKEACMMRAAVIEFGSDSKVAIQDQSDTPLWGQFSVPPPPQRAQ
jgi:hypothetical protein